MRGIRRLPNRPVPKQRSQQARWNKWWDIQRDPNTPLSPNNPGGGTARQDKAPTTPPKKRGK